MEFHFPLIGGARHSLTDCLFVVVSIGTNLAESRNWCTQTFLPDIGNNISGQFGYILRDKRFRYN